jgi:hypothetical protein
MTQIPYLAHLRRDLVGGIEQRRRRRVRARRTALAGAPALAAGLAALVVIAAPGGTSSALAIDRQGDWIELRLADAGASSDEMQRELRAAGIDASVQLVPVSEPAVGRWACVAEVADAAPAGADPDGAGPLGQRVQVRLSEVEYGPTTIRIRRDFAQTAQDGRLLFVAGRAAASGEQAVAAPCEGVLNGGRVVEMSGP